MKKINAVIFDMDGVLIDSERISFKCYQDVFKEYKYEMDEKTYVGLIGRNLKGLKEKLQEQFGKDFPFDEIYNKKSNMAIEITKRDGVIVKPGVHEFLDYLIKNNYKIAVATSTRKERAIELLEEANILKKVNYVIGGNQVENSKPNPEIFLKAAKGLQEEPENCMVVEDSDAGIRAAHAANMTGIHVPDMKQLDEENKNLPFKICENLLSIIEVLESNNIK